MEIQSPIGYSQEGLGGVLKQHKLTVPIHQREYAWEEKQVTQLLQDFSRCIAERNEPYFLGTIVTIPEQNGSFQVIDGQQRLATTALLIHAIAKHLKSIGESTMADNVTDYIKGPASDRRNKVSRLTLNRIDNELFQNILDDKPLPQRVKAPSNQRLLDAFELASDHIKNIVSSFEQKAHGDILNIWLNFIEYNALVMLLKVSNRAHAFRMFETLNDRGLKTSQADLVKNYIFGQAGGRIDECQAHWDAMRGILSTIESDEEITLTFIRHSMVLMHGYLTEKEVFDKVEQTVRGEQTTLTFSDSLEKLAYEYAAISNPSHEKWSGYPEGLERALDVLGLFNIKPMRPLIMSISLRFRPAEALKAFAALGRWGVRIVVASTTRSGSVEQPLVQAATEVYSGKIADLKGLREKLKPIVPSDLQFKESFASANSSQASISAYYLRELEYAKNREVDPHYVINEDKEKVNVEHVMPQKPDVGWDVDPDVHKIYFKRIGNLCLMSKVSNSRIKSVVFSERKEAYSQTPFLLTKEIADLDEWNELTISTRQQRLAELAVKAWPL